MVLFVVLSVIVAQNALSLLLALPLSGAACFGWLRPWIKKLARRYRERQPYRKLRKTLAALGARAAETDSRRFYISLLDAARLYLNHLCRGNCTACTTRELALRFERYFPDKPAAAALLDIFRFGDEVKFGGRESPREKRLQDIGTVGAAASRMEAGRLAKALARPMELTEARRVDV